MESTNNTAEKITSKSEGLHQSTLDSDVYGLNQAYWMYLQQLARKNKVYEMPAVTTSVTKLLAEAEPSSIEKLLSSAHLTFITTLHDESIKRKMEGCDGCSTDENHLCKIIIELVSEGNTGTYILLNNPLFVINHAYWFLFKRYAQHSPQDASVRFRLSLETAELVAKSSDNQLRALISSSATFKPLIKMTTVSATLASQDGPNNPKLLSKRLFDFLSCMERS